MSVCMYVVPPALSVLDFLVARCNEQKVTSNQEERSHFRKLRININVLRTDS